MTIDELKELEEKATPGPWKVRPNPFDNWGTVTCFITIKGEEWRLPVCTTSIPWMYRPEDLGKNKAPSPIDENAHLISAMRNLAAELLALWQAGKDGDIEAIVAATDALDVKANGLN